MSYTVILSYTVTVQPDRVTYSLITCNLPLGLNSYDVSMQNSAVHFMLPASVKEDFTVKTILHNLLGTALTKKEYYGAQARFFSGKYKMTLASFKSRLKKSRKEEFVWWDDLMEWEAGALAAQEWDKKYKDLVRCLKSYKK